MKQQAAASLPAGLPPTPATGLPPTFANQSSNAKPIIPPPPPPADSNVGSDKGESSSLANDGSFLSQMLRKQEEENLIENARLKAIQSENLKREQAMIDKGNRNNNSKVVKNAFADEAHYCCYMPSVKQYHYHPYNVAFQPNQFY